jgi:hemerythrin
MPLITWNETTYGVKNSLIDSQHQELIALINELNEAMASRSGYEVTAKVLEKTLDYTYYHFQEEEGLMARFAYPDIVQHQAQHEAFRTKVNVLLKQNKEHVGTVPRELLMYLRDWLLNHIVQTDKKLGQYLSEQGQS